MELNTKAIITIVAASALIGAYTERYFQSQTKITEDKKINKDITTVIKEHDNKDGSIDKDITIVDHSKQEEKNTETITTKAPNWLISGGAGIDRSLYTVYTASVYRRVLGPVFLGVWGSTQESVGVAIAVQF